MQWIRHARPLVCCRIALIVLVALVLTVARAQAGELTTTRASSHSDTVRLDLRFPEPIRTPIRVDGEPYELVEIPGEASHKVVGAPDLPLVVRSVMIPDDQRVEVRVVDGRYIEYPNVLIAPSRGYISRQFERSGVAYSFGPSYQRDAFFPADVVSLGEPYIMRDCRGVAVHISPVQYNPVSRILRVYQSLSVEVVPTGPARNNALHRRGRSLNRSFNDLYAGHFVNYEGGRYDALDESGGMLIIVHDAWQSNVQPLADHKSSIGIPTTIVPVSQIGNTTTAIRNSIQAQYDSSDLAYVLLVGDAAHVAAPTSNGYGADPKYALVEGSDDYPDLFVGRFSAESAQDVDTQVARSIWFEQSEAVMQDWFRRATGIASDEGTGDDNETDIEHENNIRSALLAGGYTHVDQIYDPAATPQMVTAALNEGRGLVNYTGHGSNTSWSTTGFSVGSVDALLNVEKLPIICDVACYNGNFTSATCFAEAWLRATNGGEPTGAAAVYMSTDTQPWDPPMEGQDEFNARLMAETYHTFGGLSYAASCAMMDKYPGAIDTWGNGVHTFATWHIFGDPSLRIVGTTAPPTGLRVTPNAGLVAEGQAGGPFEPASITYTLTNHDAVPISFAVGDDAAWLDVDVTSGTIPPGETTTVTAALTGAADALANGRYVASISFENLTNHDGDCDRNATLVVGIPAPVHTFSLDANPGWTLTGEWAFGQPSGGGGAYGNPDPNGGATGANVLGINLQGDYATSPSGPSDLITTAIDCTDLMDCELHFERWLNSDYAPYVSQSVAISSDGMNWTTIWSNGTSAVTDEAWRSEVYDISAHADGSVIYLRWRHQVAQGGAWAYSGWNLDDIEIWGVPQASNDCPADLNGDGMMDLMDVGILLASYEVDAGGDVDGDGDTDLSDLGVLLAGYGYPCP
jgi:hypothetical protein